MELYRGTDCGGVIDSPVDSSMGAVGDVRDGIGRTEAFFKSIFFSRFSIIYQILQY